MISHKYKTIIVHIPKTGGTSIEKALSMEIVKGRHLSIDDSKKVYGEETFNNYFTFTFIRNPWDRMVSMFAYYKNGNEIENKSIRDELKNTSFEEFVINFEKYPWTNELRISQKKWICNDNNEIMVDYVGRYENYKKDANFILNKMGVNGTIGHTRKSNRSEYQTYYNEKTIGLVAELWKDDIEFFNYKF